MKTKKKTKILTLLEIAIVLCSVFLMALPLPAIAAEQNQEMQKVSANTITTASEDDYVLGVYGNANEDDTIDMRDLTYVKLIFFGKKPETELADAKYDGKINPLDFIQIKLIIVGKEKELTIVDARRETVTVNMPVKRIIALNDPHADAIRVFRAENKVVGVSSGLAGEKILLPMMSKLPVVGSSSKPDPEAIIALKPDVVMQYATWCVGLEEKLEPAGITVVRLSLTDPETMVEDLKKLGYILDTEEKAEEFIDWYEGYMDKIKDRTEGLSEEDKPQVYLEMYPKPDNWRYKTFGKGSSGDRQCRMVGGRNIAADIIGYGVDPEWVVEQNPDIIIAVVTSTIPSGYGVDDWTGVKAVWETAMNLPELQNINAVKNERVYVVASDIRCGIQMVTCITYWAKWFHPDLFEDLNPQAIHQEYLDRFQRVDYDIKEQGVFVYPESN